MVGNFDVEQSMNSQLDDDPTFRFAFAIFSSVWLDICFVSVFLILYYTMCDVTTLQFMLQFYKILLRISARDVLL